MWTKSGNQYIDGDILKMHLDATVAPTTDLRPNLRFPNRFDFQQLVVTD